MTKIKILKGRILYSILFIVLSSILVYNIYKFTSSSDTLQVKTYKVSDGWGYQITTNDKVFIDQPFIPVLTGKKAFPSRKSATKAGNIVKERLLDRKQPALTKKDLLIIGLDSLGNSN